jgi:hypothetical protein
LALLVAAEVAQQIPSAHEQRDPSFERSLLADLGQRLVDQGQGALDRSGAPRRVGGHLEQLGMIDFGPLLGFGHLVP